MSILDFSNLRVFINDDYHHIYKELTGSAEDSAEDKPFSKMPDLFIFAACLGSKENKYVDLRKNKRDIFVADAFEKEFHLTVLASIAFSHTNDLNIFSNPREILNINENYANGAIRDVFDILNTYKGLRPLYKFIDFTTENILNR